MARSRGSARPATRGGFGGSRSAFGSTQTRSASTMAAPAPAPRAASAPTAAAAPHPHPQQAPVAVAQPQQPGLFAQMASTAAGVAVGSAVGHTIGAGISSLFSGSKSESSALPAEQQQQAVAAPQVQATQMNPEMAKTCDVDARNFTRCLEENNGNFQICDYYLQQLKACQEAARQY